MRGRRRRGVAGRFRSLYRTPLGCGGVVASEEGLLEVFLPFGGENEVETATLISLSYPAADSESHVTREAARLLERYFAGDKVDFTLPVDRTGFSPFQAVVYEAVARIPYGEVRTYAAIAAQIGRPRAARGVGTAMARNPLPIVIPCHRVVGASGALTGYSAPGGIVSKKWLLRMEGCVSDVGQL